jgi:hypothetical protein
MRATTIKVEGDLLRELERTKPPSQTLSAYVRSLLEREMRRQKVAQAADRYADFLRETPDERTWLEEWANADLARPPRRRRR